MITLRKSDDRGHADHGWLDSHHTFSFADYYDPEHTRFRALRVINEDRVAPKMGFGMHPHRDMEIITYVIERRAAAPRLDGQHRRHARAATSSASARARASSTARSTPPPTEPVHLLQIWLHPDHKNAKPGYAEKSFAQAEPGRLHLVASKTGRDGSIPINQDTDLYLGKLRGGRLRQAPARRRTPRLGAGHHRANSTSTANAARRRRRADQRRNRAAPHRADAGRLPALRPELKP